MTRIVASIRIQAPAETVFNAVTDLENLPKTNPNIVKIEFLGEQRTGVGTRFRETRKMKEKEMLTDLEVTEFEENVLARMVTDSHGTVWDSLFSVEPNGASTELTITMDARAHAFLPKIMNPLMKGFFRRGIEGHLKDVKRYCEKQ